MNTKNEDSDYNSAYNPFPEPQTIPAGWDMSEFTSTLDADPAMAEDEEAEG